MTCRSSSDGSTAVGRLFRGIAARMAPPQKAVCECLICRQPVAAWVPFRPEGGRSPFLARLDAIGSNIERFGCPNCHSNDRERHLVLFFDKLKLWDDMANKAVLHFAPELHFAPSVAAAHPALHVMGDLFPTKASIQKIDLEDIAFPDATFDMVIGNHVLEHVGNVETALAEVRRVLKPGGRFVCQTPYAARLPRTFEEPGLQSAEDRRFFYGQDDHVRLFGRDIEARLQQAGFAGRLVPHDEILGDVDPVKLGVNEREPFFDFRRA